jgi:hypothetical protein
MSPFSRADLVSLLAVLGLVTATGISPVGATLLINGGTSGTIPEGGYPAEYGRNDVLIPLFGQTSISGVFNANITQTGTSTLEYDFLGMEAGDINTFTAPGGSFNSEVFPTNNPVAPSLSQPLLSFQSKGVNGLLPFTFRTDGTEYGNIIQTFSNGNNVGDSENDQANFFVTKLGNSLVLWFDDGGAGDADYDDFVVRISELGAPLNPVPDPAPAPTPIPGGLPLLGSGLGLMGLLAWMKRRRVSAAGPTRLDGFGSSFACI